MRAPDDLRLEDFRAEPRLEEERFAALLRDALLRDDVPREELFRALDFRAPDFRALDFRAVDLRPPDFRALDFRAADFRAPDLRAPDLRPRDPLVERELLFFPRELLRDDFLAAMPVLRVGGFGRRISKIRAQCRAPRSCGCQTTRKYDSPGRRITQFLASSPAAFQAVRSSRGGSSTGSSVRTKVPQ